MIVACPVCGGAERARVLAQPEVPIFQLVKAGDVPGPEHFADLELVQCAACGHLFNGRFDDAAYARMYVGDVLSNVPVHATMTRSLEAVANWIGADAIAGRRVLEVGAGSGHLARILARTAREVVLFEPSQGVRAEAFREPNIRLVSRRFEVNAMADPADLVVCRQVLEHVAAPGPFLAALADATAPEGRLYLEVPRAEYIAEQAAVFDVHYAHVQYFTVPNLLALAARAGLEPERLWQLKDGHDVGVLLRRRPAVPMPAPGAPVRALDAVLALRHERIREALAALHGDVLLYGATWHGVGFIGTVGAHRRFAGAIDDNPDYAGLAMYGRTQTLPVYALEDAPLRSTRTIIVTAYLHDRVIAARLRDCGFAGTILSIAGRGPDEAFRTL